MRNEYHAARAVMPEDAEKADAGKLIDAITQVEKLRRTLRKTGPEPPEDLYSRRPKG
jgi:hypothetical protein